MAIKKKKREATINDLAVMINKGFEQVSEDFKQVDRRLDSLEQGHKEMIKSNTREHEEIKLSLNNVAYRFELVELQKRVEILERKIA